MTAIWCLVAVATGVVLSAAVVAWRRGGAREAEGAWHRGRSQTSLDQAKRLFHLRREWLEADFLTLVSASGKPRHLVWSDCDFADDVVFATDRKTGQLRAFSAVTVRYKAEKGGEIDDSPTVANLREATAVYQFDGGAWMTEGRAVFNLNPLETVERFHHELQSVD